MKYWVYVIRSLQSSRRYTGITTNIERRLKEHNAGKTNSTKPYRPYEIIYTECFPTRAEARKREIYLKSGIGREYIEKNLHHRAE